METGSEEEEVLTGCPCGFWLVLVWSWRQRCVEVVCMSVQYTQFCRLKSVCTFGLTGVVEKRPVAPEVAGIQQSVSLLGGRWQLSESNLCNTIASKDGLGSENARVYISHWFWGGLNNIGIRELSSQSGYWWDVISFISLSPSHPFAVTTVMQTLESDWPTWPAISLLGSIMWVMLASCSLPVW